MNSNDLRNRVATGLDADSRAGVPGKIRQPVAVQGPSIVAHDSLFAARLFDESDRETVGPRPVAIPRAVPSRHPPATGTASLTNPARDVQLLAGRQPLEWRP